MALPVPGVDLRVELDQGALRRAFVLAGDESLTLQQVDGTLRRDMREQVRRVAIAAGTLRQRGHETIGWLVGDVLGAVVMT